MRLIAVANISDGKKTIGIRILDLYNNAVKDVPIDNLIEVLDSGIVRVENIGLKEGRLICTNGSIDRLPKVINRSLVGNSPIIIIDKAGNKGYRVCDYTGEIKIIWDKEAIEFALERGISNGKILEGSIYPINGVYNTVMAADRKEFNKEIIDEHIKVYKTKCLSIGIHPLDIKVGKDYISVTSSRKDIKQTIIPNFATEIGEDAFNGCNQLESILIPDSINSIHECAFSWCESLKQIEFPKNLESIGNSAFIGCTNLSNVKFNSNLGYIGISAFERCGSLTHINLPEELKEINMGAFSNCDSLKSVKIHDNIQDIRCNIFSMCDDSLNIIMSENLKDRLLSTFSSVIDGEGCDYSEFMPYLSDKDKRTLSKYCKKLYGNEEF